jgi:NDP-sugar pyrophosphorylase family protein
MKAMLLAAGEGRRLRPLTDNLPKPMIQVSGRPILEYTVRLLAQHGINELVVNLHHRPEAISNFFGDGCRWGVSITYSYEPELLGTAGAVKRMAHLFTETFFVVYGDNLTTCDLKRLLSYHRCKGGIGTVALHYREDPTSSGIVKLDDTDRITRFLEKPRPEEAFSHWVNAGILVLEPQVLDAIHNDGPADFGRDIFPVLLARGQPLYGYRMSEDEGLWWIDTLEDLSRVQTEWEKEKQS